MSVSVFPHTVLAYPYSRFSDPSQARGDSVRRQSKDVQRVCAEHGLTLVKEYRDLGVSAFLGRNLEAGALKLFRDHVEDGRIPKGSWLILEHLDRFSRSKVPMALSALLDLIGAGI